MSKEYKTVNDLVEVLKAREQALAALQAVDRMNSQNNLTDNFRNILKELGEDVERDGLIDTPNRFIKSLYQKTWGLRIPEEDFIKSISTSFDISYDEMVMVKRIPLNSLCEHHISPFFGTATVAYIPDYKNESKVLGISKLARIVEYYSARLQVQERLTNQIADCLEKICNPLGIGVFIESEHTCMTQRGIKAHGSTTITTSFRGCFKTDQIARSEFLMLCK